MSVNDLEKAILAELKLVSGNHAIRLKDLMEWSPRRLLPQKGETLYYLPQLQIHCSVKDGKGKV